MLALSAKSIANATLKNRQELHNDKALEKARPNATGMGHCLFPGRYIPSMARHFWEI